MLTDLIDLTRIRKYAGGLLIFWPYAWSVTMVARTFNHTITHYVQELIIGLLGAFLLRTAGVIWNDIVDREIDKHVERTKTRPIPSGRVSVTMASALLVLFLLSLVHMLSQLGADAWNFGLVAIFILPGVYPYCKRFTHLPQAWLGLAMNVGIPMPWLSLSAAVPYSAIYLYICAWSWTMWYDTIYACQDKKDDVNVGIKSSALLFGNNVKAALTSFECIFIAALLAAGRLNNQGVYFYAISVFCAGLYLIKLRLDVDLDSPRSCGLAFHSNGVKLGALVWAGLLVDYISSVESA